MSENTPHSPAPDAPSPANAAAAPSTSAPVARRVGGVPSAWRRSRRGRGKTSEPVLGIHVTATTLQAVLLRPTSDGFETIRQFTRQRSLGGASVSSGFEEVPGSTSSDDGVTIEFSEGGGGSDLFLDSEFASLGLAEDVALEAAQPPRRAAAPIVFELKDLLEECRAAGFERPGLCFVIGLPDIEYVEVTVPADEKKGEAKKGKEDAPPARTLQPVRRERLLALLPKGDVLYDKERVAFLPMTPRENLRRYLALVPRPEEPVEESLTLLREQQGMRRIPFKGMTAEVPMLVGMARFAFPTEPHENTAIVRVGTEDTLVILLQGDQLHHCDHMRSVTTFDGPETICSRVLLQQDVQGVGTVHNVIVISEEREEELVQGFGAFYPEARVETLRAGMEKAGLSGPYGPLPTQAMAPAGAALPSLLRKDSPFEDVDLLPKQLRRRAATFELSFSWHTAVVGVIIFLSVLFYVGLFFKQQSDIATVERRLAAMPAEVTMTGGELQMRIDSLRSAQQRIVASLSVLDSLLYGTDRWSQTLARTSTAASGTGSVWVEDWTPQGREVVAHGFSTSRDAVVSLAGRLDASIEEMIFNEIREYPVYEYRLRYALPYDLPASVRYLREQAGEALPVPPPPPEPLAGSVPLDPPQAPVETGAPTE